MPRRKAMTIGQRLAIHFVGDEGGGIHRLLERKRIGVIIDAVQADFGRAVERATGSLEQGAHRDALPKRVAHQPGIEAVADAHQRCFLIDGGKRFQFFESISARRFDEAGDLEPPKRSIDLRIDDVLRDAIELVVRRDPLDLLAFVLRPVVAERRRLKEGPQKSGATTGDDNSQAAEQKARDARSAD